MPFFTSEGKEIVTSRKRLRRARTAYARELPAEPLLART
jgi:hypothetical protein